MGAGKETQTIKVSDKTPHSTTTAKSSMQARSLRKSDLGGVIFGCKNCTMKECLSKQLFGLPSPHFSYVKNIEPGLPLFLFNHSNRKLHGIYEAASLGKMNIDPYAWTDSGTERTAFPAQVQIFNKMNCQPLNENQFKEIIKDNYYSSQHFWFELDHAQTKCLIALFKPILVCANAKVFPLANSKDSYYTAVPKIRWKAVSSSDHMKSELGEREKDSIYFNAANGNMISSLCWNDMTTDGATSSRTSSSATEDREPKEVMSDWENDWVNETLPVSQSSGESSTFFEQHFGGDGLGNIENTGLPLEGQGHLTLDQDSGDEGLDDEEKRVLLKLRKLAADCRHGDQSSRSCADDSTSPCVVIDTHADGKNPAYEPSVLCKVEEPNQFDLSNGNTESVEIIRELTERISLLEKKQVESDYEIQHMRGIFKGLKECVEERESKHSSSTSLIDEKITNIVKQYICSEEVIYVIGGYDGTSWLSALDSFSPSTNILKPLKSMSSARSNASAVVLNGSIYVFGGGDGHVLWYDTVERYNPSDDEWSLCSHLNRAKGSLAGAVLNNKIYAIGGGDSVEGFSDVEMFDPALGRWLNSPRMLEKRFAPAAAEFQGVLYAVGGYDGRNYLLSAERYDPREAFWTKIPSMETRRGAHSMAVLNDKLYAIGGYDGDKMVPSVEVFDPRLASWLMAEPMNFARGYAAAAVIETSLFVIGGLQHQNNIVDSVECYREGTAWATTTGLGAIGKRCFFSAAVI